MKMFKGVMGLTSPPANGREKAARCQRKVSSRVLYRTLDTLTPSAFPMLPVDSQKTPLGVMVSEGVTSLTPSRKGDT
jgi:hypothetical protein